MDDTTPTLRIAPLGGLGEVGMNMMVYESGDSLIVVDAGTLFPENSLLGIDLIIPDMAYLEEKRAALKAVFITHSHEDHVGALPYLLKRFPVPIYASRFAAAYIRHKLKEHGLRDAQVLELEAGKAVQAGDFNVLPVEVTHSVADTFSFAIRCAAGTVVHTGDFKIDLTPSDRSRFDFHTFASLGRQGVDLLLMDSTNSMERGHAASEREVARGFDSIFNDHEGRIIVTLFSSSIPRIISLLALARRHKRKVAVEGRSLRNNLDIAVKLGYLKRDDSLFIEPQELDAHPSHKLLVLVSGSQGESRSALTRIAHEEHPHIVIREGDLVVFSARQIPGNERSIDSIINKLSLLGAKVYSSRSGRMIHASGHAYREELRTMLQLVRPRHFIPIHGEPHHLISNLRLAQEMGVPRADSLLLQDGETAELSSMGLARGEAVRSGRIYVDGVGVGDVEDPVIRDRKKLAQTGVLMVVLSLNRELAIVSGPEFIQRGVTSEPVMEDILIEAEKVVRDIIDDFSRKDVVRRQELNEELRIRVRRIFNRRFKRKPVVVPVLLWDEPDETPGRSEDLVPLADDDLPEEED